MKAARATGNVPRACDGNARRREQVASLRPGLVVNLRRGRLRGRVAIVDVRRGERRAAADRRRRARRPRGAPRHAGLRLGARDRRRGPAPARRSPVALVPRRGREAALRAYRTTRSRERRARKSEPAERPAIEASSTAWEAVREHPVHACPDREEHETWAERYDSLDEGHRGVAQGRDPPDRNARADVRARARRAALVRLRGRRLADREGRAAVPASTTRATSWSPRRWRKGCSTTWTFPISRPSSPRSSTTRAGSTSEVRWPADRVRKAFGCADADVPADPRGRGSQPHRALPRAGTRVRRADLVVGEGRAARGGARDGRAFGRGLRAHDEAGLGSAAPARRGRALRGPLGALPERRREPSIAGSSRTAARSDHFDDRAALLYSGRPCPSRSSALKALLPDGASRWIPRTSPRTPTTGGRSRSCGSAGATP